ncbi:MAG TPA: flagellar assembly protein FliW [Gemmatimonadales bacterium]|nr:flagellar assembly protein FliW [Gemmatimonadales bacterium]
MTAATALPVTDTVTIETRRFGTLAVPADAMLEFPNGLPGFGEMRRFVLLPVRDDLGWLQSAEHPALAFLLVRPWRVVAGAFDGDASAWAVVAIGTDPARSSANLMAPVRIDPSAGTGEQTILTDTAWPTAAPLDLTMV